MYCYHYPYHYPYGRSQSEVLIYLILKISTAVKQRHAFILLLRQLGLINEILSKYPFLLLDLLVCKSPRQTKKKGNPPSVHETPRQDQQSHVSAQAQRGQQRNTVATSPELANVRGRERRHGTTAAGSNGAGSGSREELAVALVPPVHGDEEDGDAVDGEEGADGVELGREDLEDDEGEGELAEGGAHVGAFERALGGADLDEPRRGEGRPDESFLSVSTV